MTTRSLSAVVLAAAAAAFVGIASAPAEAHNGGRGVGGGRHGGWHGGGPIGGGHFGGHSHFTPRVPVYAPRISVYPVRPPVPHVVIRPIAPAYVAPRVVIAPPVVGYGYGYGGYGYAAPPVVYSPPVTYIEQPRPQEQYWYYCADYQAYYPNVEQCPSEWMRVLPNGTPVN